MSSLALYLVGFLVVVLGITLGLHQLGVPNTWIAIVGIVLIGIGIISGVSRTRRRDSSPLE